MKEPKQTSNIDRPLSRDNPLRVAVDKEEEGQALLLNNETIIRQVLKEDPGKGFEMIFKRYYSPLCNHAARFVYSKEIAEDIVSEIFLNCWKKKLYETITSTFRAYLYTAVRNSAYNYLKGEFSEKLTGREETLMPVGFMEETDPQKILLLNELAGRIERTIDAFPPQCQKVFLMSRFEGKKNREIASELAIGIKTVEAHMMKALALLKRSLSDYLK
jgi:RNA polymerase sigma-70 factor (ECF subfamily)